MPATAWIPLAALMGFACGFIAFALTQFRVSSCHHRKLRVIGVAGGSRRYECIRCGGRALLTEVELSLPWLDRQSKIEEQLGGQATDID